MAKKVRLDQLLVQRGIAETPAKAHALILAGAVRVIGVAHSRPGDKVAEDVSVELVAGMPYVSRGGYKLAHALDTFGLSPAGLVALDCHKELQGHVAVYAKNRQLLLEALPAMGLTSIAPPDGAFYIYADIGHLTDNSLDFCQTLLSDTGVATAPGLDFDPVEGRHFIRFSFAVSTPEIKEAIRRLTNWFAARP